MCQLFLPEIRLSQYDFYISYGTSANLETCFLTTHIIRAFKDLIDIKKLYKSCKILYSYFFMIIEIIFFSHSIVSYRFSKIFL